MSESPRRILPSGIADHVEDGEYQRLQFLHDDALRATERRENHEMTLILLILLTIVTFGYGAPGDPAQDYLGYHPDAVSWLLMTNVSFCAATCLWIHTWHVTNHAARATRCYNKYFQLLCRKYQDRGY